MSHANAALTPRHRLRLARAVVEDGWSISYAAAMFNVSWPTAKRWADRYRTEGPAGMTDRSSRPHHMPRRTPAPTVRKIVHLRWKQRLGPVPIADRVGCAPSTVHAVLRRVRLNRLSHLDRATGEPIRRYEHDRPGALLHARRLPWVTSISSISCKAVSVTASAFPRPHCVGPRRSAW